MFTLSHTTTALGLEKEGRILFAGLAWLFLGATAAISRIPAHPAPAVATRRLPAI